MIDLHLHTTASDGRSTPPDLVRAAVAAGVTVMAVTDHDTVAAVAAVQAAASEAGVPCLAGIEITAVHESRDVHVLGYFLDSADATLLAFLEDQREARRERALEIARRLDRLGVPIDTAPLVAASQTTGRSIGRPMVAALLVAAGHASDIADAFDRFLAEGRPAFVERRGKTPAAVVERIHRAGGLSSLAHPGKLKLDRIIPGLLADGLRAIEAFHPDHTDEDTARYLSLASKSGVLVTGGSDYHGPGSGRASWLGKVGLPLEHYDALVAASATR